MPPSPTFDNSFDLWPWSTNLNINRDHLLIKDYLSTKIKASGAKHSWVIHFVKCGYRSTCAKNIPIYFKEGRRGMTDLSMKLCPTVFQALRCNFFLYEDVKFENPYTNTSTCTNVVYMYMYLNIFNHTTNKHYILNTPLNIHLSIYKVTIWKEG